MMIVASGYALSRFIRRVFSSIIVSTVNLLLPSVLGVFVTLGAAVGTAIVPAKGTVSEESPVPVLDLSR